MKLIFNKFDLLSAINITLKAVSNKTTMPILSCIKIDARGEDILFLSNNIELGIQTTVLGDIIERGEVCLDSKQFSDIIRKLPDGEITIETSEVDEHKSTFISCEEAKFTIYGQRGDEFPPLPYVDRENPIQIQEIELKNLIARTNFCVSTNETSRIMTGELFSINQDQLKVIAMDGHRVAIRNTVLENEYPQTRVVVPGKTLNELNRILQDKEDMIQIYLTKNHILFELDKTSVISTLLEGEYYNIEQMIKHDYSTKISIHKNSLMNTLDRSMLMSEVDKKPVILDINDKVMELRILSDKGSMKEKVNMDKEGDNIKIGFNPKFLLDALRVIEDEMVDLYLLNPQSPCFIKDDKNTYTYLVLPVNFVE